MALFEFHFHVKNDVNEEFLNQKFRLLMADMNSLKTQIAELQTALDAEQAQVAELLAANTEAIAQLNITIEQLRADVAQGGTAEERQALADQLTAIKADLEATVAP